MSPEELSQEDLDALVKGGRGAGRAAGGAPAGPERAAAAPSGAETGAPRPLSIEPLQEAPPAPGVEHTFDLLSDVPLSVRIELGRRRMFVEDVLRLGEGSVVELDKLAGDPVDILVNDIPVARGEVLVLNDYFCVRVSEILSPKEALRAPAPPAPLSGPAAGGGLAETAGDAGDAHAGPSVARESARPMPPAARPGGEGKPA